MLGFSISRLRGERGSVEALLVVASLFAAIAFTGAHLVPLSLKLQNDSEVDQAITLATPRTVRAGTISSTGQFSLLETASIQESVITYLQTFKTNVQAGQVSKEFCGVVVDMGNGESCSGDPSETAVICPQPIIPNSLGLAQGWRYNGNPCLLSLSGPAIASLLGAASSDSSGNGKWSRYYFLTARVDDDGNIVDYSYLQTRPIDPAQRALSVGTTSWTPPAGSATGVALYNNMTL